MRRFDVSQGANSQVSSAVKAAKVQLYSYTDCCCSRNLLISKEPPDPGCLAVAQCALLLFTPPFPSSPCVRTILCSRLLTKVRDALPSSAPASRFPALIRIGSSRLVERARARLQTQPDGGILQRFNSRMQSGSEASDFIKK